MAYELWTMIIKFFWGLVNLVEENLAIIYWKSILFFSQNFSTKIYLAKEVSIHLMKFQRGNNLLEIIILWPKG